MPAKKRKQTQEAAVVRAPTQAELQDAMALFDQALPEQKRLSKELNEVKKLMKPVEMTLRAHIAAKNLDNLSTPDGNVIVANRSRRACISKRWLEEETNIGEDAKQQIRTLATKDVVRYTKRQKKRGRVEIVIS
jgi:hypothetical protein